MIVWKDRRLVYLLTTHTSPAETKSVERDDRNGGTVQRSVPTAVADYNQHKSGVDTIDQLHSYYSIGRRSKKWWPRLAWWLIDMCIINAYSLFSQRSQVQSSQLDFRIQLIQSIVEAYPISSTYSNYSQHSHVGRPRGIHSPHRSEHRRTCVQCSEGRENRCETVFECKQCRVHLCIDPCFEAYHRALPS